MAKKTFCFQTILKIGNGYNYLNDLQDKMTPHRLPLFNFTNERPTKYLAATHVNLLDSVQSEDLQFWRGKYLEKALTVHSRPAESRSLGLLTSACRGHWRYIHERSLMLLKTRSCSH